MFQPLNPDRARDNVFWGAHLPTTSENMNDEAALLKMVAALGAVKVEGSAHETYSHLMQDDTGQARRQLESIELAYRAETLEEEALGLLLRQEVGLEDQAQLFRLQSNLGARTAILTMQVDEGLVPGAARYGLNIDVGSVVTMRANGQLTASLETVPPQSLPIHAIEMFVGRTHDRRVLFTALALGRQAVVDLAIDAELDVDKMYAALQEGKSAA